MTPPPELLAQVMDGLARHSPRSLIEIGLADVVLTITADEALANGATPVRMGIHRAVPIAYADIADALEELVRTIRSGEADPEPCDCAKCKAGR